MWQIVESHDEEAANEARVALETLFLGDVPQLLRLALERNESKTKEWAGIILASIGVSVWKHDEKLSKKNNAYLNEKKKIGKFRTDVWFARSRTSRLVRKKLRTVERYRSRLLVLRAVCRRARTGGNYLWERIAKRQRIPERYFGTVDLPEFSVKSEPQWWKFLWPFIRKKIDLSKLPPLKVREYDTVQTRYRSGRNPEVSPSEKKNRKRYHSDLQKASRDHLKTLARLRDSGILY
jgi:hypothetical protein